jgi:hypothetical protein
LLLIGVAGAGIASAQEPGEPGSRVAVIEQAETAKAEQLTPAAPGKAEAYVTRISDIFLNGQIHWHMFWQNAYSGGGFTLGAGYLRHVSSYNFLDVRGSVTFSGYKRAEAEFIAPELFARRGRLSVLGGWREATAVNFYGIGNAGEPGELRVHPAVPRRQPRSVSDEGAVHAGGRRRGVAVEPRPRLGQLAVDRAEVRARDTAGPRRVAGLPPYAGDRRPRLAAGARYTRRAVSTA